MNLQKGKPWIKYCEVDLVMNISYSFSGRLWQHQAPKGGWLFISLLMKMSKEVLENFRNQEEGWGRLKASAEIDGVKWETAIWYDSKKVIIPTIEILTVNLKL